jgi:hypothetical protein
MTSQLTNKEIHVFDEKLKIFNNTFLKTVNGFGVLLTEITDIKTNVNLNIPEPTTNAVANAANSTYNTAQFAGFIKNIINFNIKNHNNLPATDNNMNYVIKAANGTYSYNENVLKNTIETLKVINVFVDILEAYKNCIDDKILLTGYSSGYTNDIKIDRIELVSDTTRFYENVTMFPEAKYKNVGYIRPINETADGTKITILYLSIESFYTNMNETNDNIYYENLFTKDKISAGGVIDHTIDRNILGSGAKLNTTLVETLVINNYARQVYSGIEDNDIKISNLTLIQRNKNLIIYLLKTLFNLEPNFRKQSVNALYYYYKFIQLYSTLIINVSNVMYAKVSLSTNAYCIETINMARINMPPTHMSRSVSGIQISRAGNGYATNSNNIITITAGNQSVSVKRFIPATAKVASNSEYKIPTNTPVIITDRGEGYITKPSTTFAPATRVTGISGDPLNVQFKLTIVPIPIKNNLITQETNLDICIMNLERIFDSLTIINTELSNSSTNESNSSEIGITTNSSPSETHKSTISFSPDDNYSIITVNKISIVRNLNDLMDKEDITNNYIVYDEINKHYYTILKIIRDQSSANIIKIKINAVLVEGDINQEKNIDTKVFKNIYNQHLEIGDYYDVSPDIEQRRNFSSYQDISPASGNFLKIKKKDLNAYKNEYIYNRDDIARLDENIKRNTNIIEHQKNLYDAQYNKNLFLTRQIISYNTIIAVIIVILIFINLLNFDKLFVKTVSLICLGIVLLLFVVYFISNITYIESFTVSNNEIISISDLSLINNENTRTLSDTQYIEKKIEILNGFMSKSNAKFISFFEKLIITLPINDNVDFYKEVKGIITNDKNSKEYSNNILLFNKDDTVNNTGTIKYEIENNKLYIMSLLIATIIFITIYNLYINYVSDSRFLSLTVFICIIILLIIALYYVIRTNRRVRTFYKNIYWGPETSVRF